MSCTYQTHAPGCRVEILLGNPPCTLNLSRTDAIEGLREYSRSLRAALPNASQEEDCKLRSRIESNERSIDYLIRNR